ncbi:MAG: type II secretion system protein [Candidatus Sungbacteria bacterium]|nr:type II secretion system protein [Candidatus Sungbacteria bacterium]
MQKNKGITLIEIVVYVGLLGVIAVFISNALIQISDTYSRARAERAVSANARLILETVDEATGEAEGVYGPTSVFLADAGQLSLITPANPPAEHTTAYADFYVDNGRMWIKKEGQLALPLSATTVRVTKFRLERIMQGFNRETVVITLQIDAAGSKHPASITLNTTAALRGNY